MLTGIHTFCCALGCYISVYGLKLFYPATLNSEERWIMIAFSFLYTINIVTLTYLYLIINNFIITFQAISNVSLSMVTVPFHQVVRATTPVFTILLSILFLSKRFSVSIYISLIPVIVGVALATMGEYNFSAMGFVLTLLGTFLAGKCECITLMI